jgi:hypothetical protein
MDCLAVRTSNSPQQDPHLEPIEKGLYKAVKPEPWTAAFGTTVGSGPGEISFLLNNFIEGNTYSQYHLVTLLTGLSGPVHASGGRSVKATARFISHLNP